MVSINMQILNGGPQLMPADISGFENELGTKLPDDYKNFLLQYNGGYPSPEYWCAKAVWSGQFSHLTRQLGEQIEVISFYRIQMGHIDDITKWGDLLRDGMPADALPIGDSSSPVFLLIIDGPDRGKVMVWLPDTNPEQDQTRMEHLGFVANSFSEFMNGLYYVAP